MLRPKLAFLAVAAAMLLGPVSPARGSALDDIYTCTFDGFTGVLSPRIPQLPTLSVHGQFQFGSVTPLRCVQVDVDGELGVDPQDNTGVWEGAIQSEGSYEATLGCAVALHLHGHPWLDQGNHFNPHEPKLFPGETSTNVTDPVIVQPFPGAAQNNDSPLEFEYEIDVFGGQGYIQVTGARDSHPSTGGGHLAAPSIGAVSIEFDPDTGINSVPIGFGCLTAPATDFTIKGSFAVSVGS